MLRSSGALFHIDFGYMLGQHQHPTITLTPHPALILWQLPPTISFAIQQRENQSPFIHSPNHVFSREKANDRSCTLPITPSVHITTCQRERAREKEPDGKRQRER